MTNAAKKNTFLRSVCFVYCVFSYLLHQMLWFLLLGMLLFAYFIHVQVNSFAVRNSPFLHKNQHDF